MLGVTREALLGQPMAEVLTEHSDWETIEQATSAASVRGDAAIHEVMLRATDGRTVWCQLTSRDAGDGATRILVLTDITSLKRREEFAWHQANHDELTGLPNRRLLVEHVRSEDEGQESLRVRAGRRGAVQGQAASAARVAELLSVSIHQAIALPRASCRQATLSVPLRSP